MRPPEQIRGSGGFRLMKRRDPHGQYVDFSGPGTLEPQQRLMLLCVAPTSVKFAGGPRRSNRVTRTHGTHGIARHLDSPQYAWSRRCASFHDGGVIAHRIVIRQQ